MEQQGALILHQGDAPFKVAEKLSLAACQCKGFHSSWHEHDSCYYYDNW